MLYCSLFNIAAIILRPDKHNKSSYKAIKKCLFRQIFACILERYVKDNFFPIGVILVIGVIKVKVDMCILLV